MFHLSRGTLQAIVVSLLQLLEVIMIKELYIVMPSFMAMETSLVMLPVISAWMYYEHKHYKIKTTSRILWVLQSNLKYTFMSIIILMGAGSLLGTFAL